MNKFVNYHVHTTFSMLDGAIKIPDLFNKVKQLNQPAVVITDHGVMHGMADAAQYSQQNNQKFIPGCELYMVDNANIKGKSEKSSETDNSRKHLLLLAKNNEGYKRLMKICSWGCTKGYYYRPRCDNSILEQYGTDGIIATSACFVPDKHLDVLTKDGIKNLLDVKSGDYVKTHTGTWQKVLYPTTRNYEGAFYQFTVTGEFPVTVTENHKFFVLDISSSHSYQNYSLPWNNNIISCNIIDNISVIPAKDLNKDKHCLIVPLDLPDLSDINKVQGAIIADKQFIAKLFSTAIVDLKNVLDEHSVIRDTLSIRKVIIYKDELAQNYCIYTQDKTYLYQIKSKLQNLLISSQLCDNNTYYELIIPCNKIDALDNIQSINTFDIPFIYNNRLYIRKSISSDIISFVDTKQVHCLNVEDDHSFVINNIAVHNCMAGLPAQRLLNDDYQGAKKAIQYYAKLFKDGYYLEIQPVYDDSGKQLKINKGLIELSKELGIPLVAATDAHYLNKDDKKLHDVLLCIQSGAKLSDPQRWSFPGNSFYIMSREEIIQAFQQNGHEILDQHAVEEAIDNTVEMANQCDVHFTFGQHYLPKINPYKDLQEDPQALQEFNNFEYRRFAEIAKKDNISIEDAKNRLDPSAEYLRYLVIHGWHGLYAQGLLDERHLSLMLYELDTIISLGFPSYFLILADIDAWCLTKQKASAGPLSIGPGRGCGSEDNLVNVLNKGMQKINNININDYVLAVDGKYHKVLNTYEYDCDEDLVEIMTENDKLISGLTKDHKVLGIKKSDYIDGKEYQLNELKWYPIDELNIDDYLIQIS